MSVTRASRLRLQGPKFTDLFDWKLLLALGAVVTVGFAACDLVNRSVDKRLLQPGPQPDPSTWKPGTTAHVTLALQTQDAERLLCASEQQLGDLRCEFRQQQRRYPRDNSTPVDDNKRNIVQPYRTAIGNHPVLLAGVWYTPEVAFRRHNEPARMRRTEPLQTFYADCEVEFVGQFDQFDTRYDFSQKWEKGEPTAVGRATWCTVIEQSPNL